MLRDDNDEVESEELPALTGSRPGHRAHHWRQQSLAARRANPTTIDSALGRVTASATAIRAYLDRLKQLEQWLTDRVRAIDVCLGRVRCIERVVAGVDMAPALPGDCPSHLLLVACYADLARQALHGEDGWSSTGSDKSEGGDVQTSLTADCLFGPLHDAATAAGLAVLTATDQREPAAALQVEGNDDVASTSTSKDGPTVEQQREYTSLMSIIPPVEKRGRRFGDLLSLLTKPLYQLKWYALTGDIDRADERHQSAALDATQLRSFADFVEHSRPIVRVFSLPPDRRLVLSYADDKHRGTDAGPPLPAHDAPSALMEQLVDVVLKDIQRRFQTETYGAHVVLGQLTRRLDTAPRVADNAAELMRELETHAKLLEMSSRYDNMDALTQSLITCAVERVRTQSTTVVDKWKSACPCRSLYHVVVQ